MLNLFDRVVALILLTLTLPIFLIAVLAIFLQDRKNPFYIARRVAAGGGVFNMIKLRSMVKSKATSQVFSTSNDDKRITFVGKVLRRFKIDELGQLINVVKGEMSIVGPRPQVLSEVERYTEVEKRILEQQPGITDIASIVFSDEGDILEGKANPDLAYNQLIRPWKSRLALLYIKNCSFKLNVLLIIFTLTNTFARNWTLKKLSLVASNLKDCDEDLVRVMKRKNPLVPTAPPGALRVVETL